MAADFVHSLVLQTVPPALDGLHELHCIFNVLEWILDARLLRWVFLVTLFGGWLALEAVLLQSSYVSNS
jgi:hypothetical protein